MTSAELWLDAPTLHSKARSRLHNLRALQESNVPAPVLIALSCDATVKSH